MKSYTTLRNAFGSLSNNTSINNLTLGDQLINDSLRYLTTKYFFNERSYTVPGGTISSQQSYELPHDIKTIINVYILVGDIRYQLIEAPTRQFWDSLNFVPYTSDVPQYYFIYNKKIYIFPSPASASNVITINYKTRLDDLSISDYTTGTVTIPYATTTTAVLSVGDVSATLSGAWSLASGTYQVTFSTGEIRPVTLTNGATTMTWTTALTLDATTAIVCRTVSGGEIVTGAGTTFNPQMVGCWLKVTPSTSATASGDGDWYEIGSFISTTMLTLVNKYQGNPVTLGAITIGQMPVLPEDYQDLPVYRALSIYFTTRVPDPTRATMFDTLYKEGFAKLDAEFGSKSNSVAITPNDSEVINPNLYVRNIS